MSAVRNTVSVKLRILEMREFILEKLCIKKRLVEV